MSDPTAGARGFSGLQMRKAVCKDCLREERAREAGVEVAPEDEQELDTGFVYNERAALARLERGQTRSDRCRRHRARHRVNIQGMAVPYIDLQTIGTVLDPENPTGPFGGLGPMPGAHEITTERVDLGEFGFGMQESDIMEILGHLANPKTRVLVVKAGTGTGKSTYMPYRLLDPPEGAPIRLTDLGPIVVTEPRVQATTGVAGFVGTKMSGAGGVGPGYPVGFQVSGNRAHDDSCQLIFVTDGTMINWLREGRLSSIGTVIVDEAHERSTNIDFIMGYLKQEVANYPHLRVIVTSATFDAEFYREYFGGPGKVEVVTVPAVKTIGYGFPLFGDLDAADEGGASVEVEWKEEFDADLPLRRSTDPDSFVTTHFTRSAPPLTEDDVAEGHEDEIGWPEDLHETTRKLLPLRFTETVPEHQWKEKMPETLAEFVVKLARGLDREGIYGDILGFLPTGKTIEEAVEIIRAGTGYDAKNVFALLSSLPVEEKEDALAARRKGDPRKIVISTNLAETSLTVEGVRFVVDSGLIAQSDWNPGLAQGGIPTIQHSRAGVRQRWGRVGRKSPGWVFPLYSKAQFLGLPKNTPPGSTRDNLEELVMTAKLGGIDNVLGFDWPAKFEPKTLSLDKPAEDAIDAFKAELRRADEALRASGAVDEVGDPTSFGKELARAPGLDSAASTIAIMHADRLACVPEVVTILALLEAKGANLLGSRGLLLDALDWPDEWRLEAAERNRALASGCQDDAELVLQVMSVWERADPDAAPWAESAERERWARRWWINHELLMDCAKKRREVLEGLSPAMKEEVKRFVEPALVRRARGAISRAMGSLEYRQEEGAVYRGVSGVGDQRPTGVLGNSVILDSAPERFIPLKRSKPDSADHAYLSHIVTLEDWALPEGGPDGAATGVEAAMELLRVASVHGGPDTSRDLLSQLQAVWPAGSRVQLTFEEDADGATRIAGPPADFIPPAAMPEEAPEEAEEDDDEVATEEDASPELDTKWPTPIVNGRRVELEVEPEVEARYAVTEVEENEVELRACGECDQCRSGDPGNCEDPYEPGDPDGAVDELAGWRDRASRNVDVSRPLVRLTAGEPNDGDWYEVVGYDVDAAAPLIFLRPDWRRPGSAWVPGVHEDLEPGQPIEVVVGPEIADHHDSFWVFERADGLGRFVLREAQTKPERQEEQHQLAISLNRRTHGLLERLVEGARLTARVVPRPQPGCSTITFLELLRRHWGARANRYEAFDVTRPDGTTGTGRYFGTLAVDEPNDAGWVTTESLLYDEAVGIAHLMGVYVEGAEDVLQGSDIEKIEKGAPLLVRVLPETARLEIGGLPVEAVNRLMSRHPDLFHPPGPRRKGDDADPAPADDDGGLIPRGWVLSARSTLTTDAARDLSELDATREWEAACWFFWARSHHLRTFREDGFRPGSSTKRLPVPVDDPGLDAGGWSRAVENTITGEAPAHWLGIMRRQRARLCERLGADSLEVRGKEMRVGFDSSEGLARGTDLLREMLESPAVKVAISEGRVGSLIGREGANIKRLQAIPGVWAVSFDSESSELLAIGQAGALSEVLRDVAAKAGGATGRMTVGAPADNGRLIGRQGVVITDLKTRSGCTYAQSLGRDSVEWSLAGPTAAAILEFINLAQAIVPGARGEVVSVSEIQVTDLNRGVPVPNPDSHRWAGPEPELPEVGARYRSAKVIKTTTFGAFVELFKGTDGLLHISNVSPGERVDSVEEVLGEGDEIDVIVVEVDHERGRIGLRLSSDPAVTGKSVEELTAVEIGPGSGTGSLDAEEPRRSRRVRRERRRTEPIGSAEAAPSWGADAPVRITALATDIPPDDRPLVLAKRAAALIKLYSDIQLMTISASRGLVAELEQRRDGVVTIRSRFLSPGQRVLPAHAKTQLGQLTESALRELSAAEMGSVEVHTQPPVQGDPPPRVLASERQLATAADLVAALRRGTSRRQIELEEDRGVLRLVRADDLVDLIVSIDSTRAKTLSVSLDQADLEEKVIDCLVEISSWSGFGGDALEDRFPLPGIPSYGETRALIENMVRTHGDFTLWEMDPVERMVLSARMTPERELVIRRPHMQPTPLRFGIDMESIEGLQRAIEEVREFHGEALEVRATLLVWLARKAPPPMGNEPSGQRRRWGRPD